MRFISFALPSARITRAAITVAVLCAVMPWHTAMAAEPNMATSSLKGTWTLVAADEILKDGSHAPQFGAHPQGLLIVDAEGRYSLQIFRGDRTRFAQADKTKGTADEFRAAELSMNSHYGTVDADPAQHTLVFHIAMASFPNWNGTVQVRQYTMSGGMLSYQIPPSATGSGKISVSVWRRTGDTSQPAVTGRSDP